MLTKKRHSSEETLVPYQPYLAWALRMDDISLACLGKLGNWQILFPVSQGPGRLSRRLSRYQAFLDWSIPRRFLLGLLCGSICLIGLMNYHDRIDLATAILCDKLFLIAISCCRLSASIDLARIFTLNFKKKFLLQIFNISIDWHHLMLQMSPFNFSSKTAYYITESYVETPPKKTCKRALTGLDFWWKNLKKLPDHTNTILHIVYEKMTFVKVEV